MTAPTAAAAAALDPLVSCLAVLSLTLLDRPALALELEGLASYVDAIRAQLERLDDPTRMPSSVRVGGLPAASGRPDADPHTARRTT